MLNSLQLALCEMQAKLFELSVDRQYDSENFVKEYMNSKTVKALDSSINHLQWAGTKYVMAQVEDELRSKLRRSPHLYDKETMYWTGYLYRYWHYYTGESSKEIYRQAPASAMRVVFLPYHTLGNELAIDRLKETSMVKQVKQLDKKPRFHTKIGCYPNDATYRGNAVDDNFSFLSPIARVHDDEDDFNSYCQFPAPLLRPRRQVKLLFGEPLFLDVHINECYRADGSIDHRIQVKE